MWNYTLIKAQTERLVGGDKTLSPPTIALCLSALSKMDSYNSWDALTTAQFDEVSAWLATAYLELMLPAEGNPMQFAILEHVTSQSVDGGASTANTLNLRPLSIRTDDYSLISLYANIITPIAGLYLVDISSIAVSAGDNFVCLYDEDAENVIYLGVMVNQGASRLCAKMSFDGETPYSVRHWTEETQSSYGLGRSAGAYGNVFCTARFYRYGDIED